MSLIAALLASTTTPAAAQDRARERLLEALRETGRVGPDLLAAYATDDRAPVVIRLDVPPRDRIARAERRALIRARSDELLADCPPADFRLRHRFEHAAGVAGELHLRALARLLRNPAVIRIDLDAGGHGMLRQAMPLVGGYTANTAGWSGAGVTAAVLDSGLDSDHPDLAPALVAQHCICLGSVANGPCCPNGTTSQTGPGAAEDDNGHGSLVTGVLVGRGIAGGSDASIGIAPAASVVAVKVLDRDLVFRQTSDVAAALEWIVANFTALPPQVSVVRVVNLSLATSARFTGSCDAAGGAAVALLADAVDELTARGVVVVAAAGNSGDDARLPAPACLSNAISVGAVWDANVGSRSDLGCTDATTAADQITCFSNAPADTDLFAPGGRTTGPALDGVLGVASGTSFAAPLVAGCAALLLEQDPLRTPADVAALLTASPDLVSDPQTGFVFPRLDCADALGLGPGDDDSDFDGIRIDDGDNCPAVSNTSQSDVEADGVGDRCDVCPFAEDGPDAGSGVQLDGDDDGVGDACECTGPDLWPGDVDGSGTVDAGTDIFILGFNFGDTGVTPAQGDQNCDDRVDGADYTLWADHLGRSSAEIDLSP